MDQTRRIELAEKKNRGGLTEPERAEFEALQEEYFAYLDSLYPRRPVDPDRLAALEARLGAEAHPPEEP